MLVVMIEQSEKGSQGAGLQQNVASHNRLEEAKTSTEQKLQSFSWLFQNEAVKRAGSLAPFVAIEPQ